MSVPQSVVLFFVYLYLGRELSGYVIFIFRFGNSRLFIFFYDIVVLNSRTLVLSKILFKVANITKE